MRNVMRINKVADQLQKLKVYNREEQKVLSAIASNLSRLSSTYNSTNRSTISNINFSLKTNLKSIMNIHNNNIVVISKNRQLYITAANRTKSIFNKGRLR